MFNNINQERVNKAIAESDRILSLEDKMMADYASDSKSLITYDVLKKCEELRWYYVNRGVKFMPINLKCEILVFRCIIDNRLELWRFGWHLHDCYELCIPKVGAIIIGEKIIGVGEKIVLNPNEEHNPTGQSGIKNDIIVKFSKQPFNM